MPENPGPNSESYMRRGKLVKSVAFAASVFEYYLKVQIRRNDFFERYEILDTGEGRVETWKPLSDVDLRNIRVRTGEMYQDEYSATMTHDGCMTLGDRRPYDPLIEAFEALRWDGTERAGKWVETYLGAEPDPLTNLKGRKWLIAAVSRAMLDRTSRGSKVDTALVLIGRQGTLKSTIFRVLAEALVPGSYLDDYHFGMDAKETLEQTSGKWIVEDAEIRMSGARGRGHVKQSLSKQSDKARMAYERIAIEKPRRFVTVGTSNEDDFLEDATGSRRFWIVRTGRIDLEALKADVNQLWAEAKVLWENGETWWLDESEERQNDTDNLAFMEDDPWLDLLEPRIGLTGDGFLSTEGILKLLALPQVDSDTRTAKRIARLMKQLGFERARTRLGSRQARGYGRGDWQAALAGNGGVELVDTSNLVVVERGKTTVKKDAEGIL